MFDIGGGELLLIGIVALIAIGPKELPTVLRTLGQWMGKLRRMASEFQNQFQEAMREAEMADLKKQVDEMTSQAQSYANFDPVGEVRREFESAQQQIESAVADKPGAETLSSVAATEGGTPAAISTSAGAEPAAGGEPALAPRTDADAVAPAFPSAKPPSGDSEPGTQDAGGKPA
jgi:sec-independent protein translocase protein TatB